MSLYNMLFGDNVDSVPLLGMINVTKDDFCRYRDVYLNKEGTIITVLTRLGGNNREDYEYVFEEMKENPFYIKDYDDDFDNTYAYFEFKVPEKYSGTCKMMAPKEDRLSLHEMFEKEIEDAKNPNSDASKRMEAIANQIMSAMNDDNSDGGNIHFIGL